MKDLSAQILICTKRFSDLIEEGSKYYCFADEGYDFWISAPFLTEVYGVSQIKCSGQYRDNFKVSW